MSRKVGCPLPEFSEAWIELPDEWLGIHAQRRDEAVSKTEGTPIGQSVTLVQFAVAMSLLENWGGIPALNGNPEQWDFTLLPLPLIGWINKTVLDDYLTCFEFPKASPPDLPTGSTE